LPRKTNLYQERVQVLLKEQLPQLPDRVVIFFDKQNLIADLFKVM
jgi:hypothetical protein